MSKTNEILASLLMVSVAANVVLYMNLSKPADVKVDVRTEYVTVRDTVPEVVESHLTGEAITVTATVHRPEADASGWVAEHRHATNHEPDVMAVESLPDTVASVCIVGDSATVTLPVEQRVYEDSLYTAYVSGYRPRLDSISLRLPHTYKTITRTESTPSRRWAVGPTIGAGYGITGRHTDIFVGLSVTWNILP